MLREGVGVDRQMWNIVLTAAEVGGGEAIASLSVALVSGGEATKRPLLPEVPLYGRAAASSLVSADALLFPPHSTESARGSHCVQTVDVSHPVPLIMSTAVHYSSRIVREPIVQVGSPSLTIQPRQQSRRLDHRSNDEAGPIVDRD